MRERPTNYWLVTTRITVDSVLRFYRALAARRGWTIDLDAAPLLMRSRAADSLVVFVSDDWPRPNVKVLYAQH